jgi:hypothetical protein
MELVLLGDWRRQQVLEGTEAEAELSGGRRGERRDGREEPRGGMMEVLQESMRHVLGVRRVDCGYEDSARIQLNW